MADLFPRAYTTPHIEEGYYGGRRFQQEDEQRLLKSQLMNLDIARERAAQEEARQGAPLRAAERQLKMGDVQGQIGRQPDVIRREGALAAAAGTPERIASDVEAGDLESQGKVRRGHMTREADEADTFIRAFEPVIRGASTMNYEQQNEAWETAFKTMERAGKDTSKMRATDRGQLMKEITGAYQQAVNTAPTIRERIKLDEAHERAIKLEQERRKTLIAQAKERATSEKPVNAPNAVVARAMDKYRKDPKTINETERELLRDHFENTMSKSDQFDFEMAFNDRERQVVIDRHRARTRQTHPDLYKPETQQPTNTLREAEMEARARQAGVPYDPEKYDYRVNEKGQLQRKLKGK